MLPIKHERGTPRHPLALPPPEGRENVFEWHQSTLAVPCGCGHSFEQALDCHHITWDETQKVRKTRICLLMVTLLATVGLVSSASQNHQTVSMQGESQTASVSRFPHGRTFQPYPDDKRPLCSDGL